MDKLAEWMKRILFTSKEDDSPITKFTVAHMMVTQKGVNVGSVSVDEGDAEMLAQKIYTIAEDDANRIGGNQKYACYAFAKSKNSLSRFVFRIDGEEEETENEIVSEPPNKIGIVSQMMRHTEASMKTSVGATMQIIAMQNRTISEQQETIRQLQAKVMDGFVATERLHSEAKMRELEEKKLDFEITNKQAIMDKVGILIPTVVNRIAGRNLLPEKSTPEKEILRSLMESLRPDQMSQLQTVLDGQQMMVILSMYDKFRTEEEAKTKKNGASSDNGKEEPKS
jgi:hypothetical protein